MHNNFNYNMKTQQHSNTYSTKNKTLIISYEYKIVHIMIYC